MSQSSNTQSNSLYKIVALVFVAVGVLILAGLLYASYAGGGHGSAQHTATSHDDDNHVDDSTMAALRDKYDALAVADGRDDAPVTIREFGDYQCPACARFVATSEKIRKNEVKSGKVRFLFYDFPLHQHANSVPAAIAARCAEQQGKFWPYHEHLYAAQGKWAGESDPTSNFLDIALESGVDVGKLKSCMADKAPLATIEKERKAGEAIQLRATPTVMVGDRKFTGVPNYEQIRQAIREASPNGSGETQK